MYIVVENPDLTNTQFPDQSSIGNSNNEPGKIKIDFDDLIVQGLQRNWSRKVKKQEKMERCRRVQERPGASENHLQNEGNGATAEETRIDE